MSVTTIACAQLPLDIEDHDINFKLTTGAIKEACSKGADIIVLPELASSGYMFESIEEARSRSELLNGKTITAWSKALAGTNAVVIGGFCEDGEDGNLYNSVVLVTANGAEHVYRKVHLWGSEQLYFKPGDKAPAVIKTVHGRVAISVCYDAYFPEFARAVALAGAQLFVLPTNAPRNIPGEASPPASFGDTPMQLKIWSAMAHVNGMFVAGCDRCGPERGVDWVGASAIFDNYGLMLAEHPEDFGSGLLFAECDLPAADNKVRGSRNDLLKDRRPDLYS